MTTYGLQLLSPFYRMRELKFIDTEVLTYMTAYSGEAGTGTQLLPDSTSVCAKSLPPCPTLCDPMDCSPPGSSVHGILQTKILQWVAMPSSRGASQPRDQTHVSPVSCIGRRILYHSTLHKHYDYTIDTY